MPEHQDGVESVGGDCEDEGDLSRGRRQAHAVGVGEGVGEEEEEEATELEDLSRREHKGGAYL